MIGFFIGALCLVGLIKTIRHGRGWHGGSHGRRGWRGRGWGPRAVLYALFERLDASPGQEKVISAALEDLWKTKREVGDEFVQSRKDVARAMQGERFDETALNDAFARQDALLAKLRESLKISMTTIHEALDDRQRKVAASLLENGGLFAHGGGGGCGQRFGRHHHSHHDGGGYGDPPGAGPYRGGAWA